MAIRLIVRHREPEGEWQEEEAPHYKVANSKQKYWESRGHEVQIEVVSTPPRFGRRGAQRAGKYYVPRS